MRPNPGPPAGVHIALIRIEGLQFAYAAGGFSLAVDRFQAPAGRSMAITGPSGCGKTTMLNLIAGVLAPDAGSVYVDDARVDTLSETRRRSFRLARIGMVFQEFDLLDYLTVLENILLPYRLGGGLTLDDSVRARARELADRLGIARHVARLPTRLSQGERQRVALARALVTEPALVLADEPTGNLDTANKQIAADLLIEAAGRLDATLIVVTHDHEVAARFDRAVAFDDLCSGVASAGATTGGGDQTSEVAS